MHALIQQQCEEAMESVWYEDITPEERRIPLKMVPVNITYGWGKEEKKPRNQYHDESPYGLPKTEQLELEGL